MPKRTDIKSILIIGAGPIVIGQACEFDYSGAQACKSLREEGYRVILTNSNPATIMTDPDLADATYIEPIHWKAVEKIIEKERPDALLPTMGGQTALNCALDLVREGVLKKYDCELIGANQEAIDKAEDRQKFRDAMDKIGLSSARSHIAHSMEEAWSVQSNIGFPAIIRPSFTLGGTGGGIAYNHEEFEEICTRGFDLSPTHELLIEESLLGWKEFEMEVVRDRKDNCIIVCAIENFDPMGVHTGDSITVAPAQTLTDKEYQLLRNASIAVLREVGVDTGGSNVQFAINPKDGRIIVIEMNPRVSRSSALASKATGFPIAKIAAKLSIGYTLDELQNDITNGKTPASFEPSIDYVVTKVPRFTFEKFPEANPLLTTQMKSVGETMAIGRTFQESLQKALFGLEIDKTGLDEIFFPSGNFKQDETLCLKELRQPGAFRIWYLADAFRLGISLEKIFATCSIDPWFLHQIKELIDIESSLKQKTISALDKDDLWELKRKGFSDKRLAYLLNCDANSVYVARNNLGVLPAFKRVDTCAGEFATDTAYMYSTYEHECEARPTSKNKIIIIGGGPNRIGQGIEFDYCCVHAALALREDGWETIMVNCNPETVSTDYDTSDRLYFEPLTHEHIMNIVAVEKPHGVIVHYGGQTPLKLAKGLLASGVSIIGTSPEAIDRAEDREQFKELLDKLSLLQPANRTAKDGDSAALLAEEVGFPLVVRPSYVLGGRAMEIVFNQQELKHYIENAVQVSNDSPVLLDYFLDNAVELDVDAVSDGEEVIVAGIMEHIEQAGIHSGDSACCLPPHQISDELIDRIREQTIKMAKELNVVGLMNVQFAIKGDDIYVIEVNPRASRTVPFVSKTTAAPWAKIAARCMVGKSLKEQGVKTIPNRPYFAVKESVFPFNKFPGIDPVLSPEMRSTGEVMGVGLTFGEAFAKGTAAANTDIPLSGTVFFSIDRNERINALPLAKKLKNKGFNIMATRGTLKVLEENGIEGELVNKVSEGRPNVVDAIKNKQIDLIINTTGDALSIRDSSDIRRVALMKKITCATTLRAASAMIQAMDYDPYNQVTSLQDLQQK